MMRPMTCLSLLAALGAGLYLYEEKHTAQVLDRNINRTVKQAEESRARIGVLKAEWALLNESERLQGLAAQHLQLQPLAPGQFARLEDLPSRLPVPSAMPVLANEAPVPAAAPIRAQMPMPALAAAAPLPAPAAPASLPGAGAALPRLAAAQPAAPARKPVPVPAVTLQLAAAKPVAAPPAPHVPAAARPAPEPVFAAPPAPRPFYAPVMPAYSPAPFAVHGPTLQIASAVEQHPAPFPAPFVGSALGTARTALAAPVPVATAYSAR